MENIVFHRGSLKHAEERQRGIFTPSPDYHGVDFPPARAFKIEHGLIQVCFSVADRDTKKKLKPCLRLR